MGVNMVAINRVGGGNSLAEIFYNQMMYYILDSKEYMAVLRSAGKLNPTSAGSFLKAILGGVSVKVTDANDSGLSQLFVDIKHRKIIEGIIEGVDNLTISRSRKRLFTSDLDLEFLNEILEMKTNVRASFLVDLKTGKIHRENWDGGGWKQDKMGFIKGIVQMVINSILTGMKVKYGKEQTD